jgi:ribosomal protein L24
MTPVGLNKAPILNQIQTDKLNNQQSKTTRSESQEIAKTLPVEPSKVMISDQAKALLAASPETEDELQKVESEKPGDVTSFTYGALGLAPPETISEEENNSSYTAGQYLKGALTIGSILLAVV